MADKTHSNKVENRVRKNQGKRAEAGKRKGLWARYTDRLKNTHCTRTPPECR